MTLTMTCRLLLLLLVLCFLHSTTVAVDTTETCQVTENGDCVQNDQETTKKNDECVDQDQRCAFWASQGECDANPNYMLRSCQKSCEVCYTGKTPEQIIKEFHKKKEQDKE